MRLLSLDDNGELRLTSFSADEVSAYAILSHTWGSEADEVKLKDIKERTGSTKLGFKKIRFCGDQAAQDNIRYFWADTCCIDKSNGVELNEAICSMYRWYSDASKCYVCLSDVSSSAWGRDAQKSRWFTRGWTLQELIAPSSVDFFSNTGQRLGDKDNLIQQLHQVTAIEIDALQGSEMSEFSVSTKWSWARSRQTKREEDMVYSLLGIFGVSMPLIYGRGA